MTLHFVLDFLLGGVIAGLLAVCWRQQVEIHHLRSRLVLTRPMTIAEIQRVINANAARMADNVEDAP